MNKTQTLFSLNCISKIQFFLGPNDAKIIYMKAQYKTMFPDEFLEAIDKNPLAYLPLGSMEFHGWHNVLGLDSIKAKRICQFAAERTGGIVLPVLSIGYDLFPNIDSSKHPNKRYDCYHIDPELYLKVLEQYFKDIFKVIPRLLRNHAQKFEPTPC